MRHQHQTIELSTSKVEEVCDRPAFTSPAGKTGCFKPKRSRLQSSLLVVRRLIAVLFVAFLGIRAINAADHVTVAAECGSPKSSYHGFKADWIDDVIDVINDLIGEDEEEEEKTVASAIDDGLSELEATVRLTGGIAPDIRPWAGAVLDYVEGDIEQAQQVLVEARSISLDLKAQRATTTFATLEECAAQCLIWAQEARDEMDQPSPDGMVVDDLLEAIRLALPQYRALAGIQ